MNKCLKLVVCIYLFIMLNYTLNVGFPFSKLLFALKLIKIRQQNFDKVLKSELLSLLPFFMFARKSGKIL